MIKAKQRLVQLWTVKAHRDLIAAQRLAPELPDIAIYHCQQAAEKALKAVLAYNDQDPGKTHNLATLIQQVSAYRPQLRSRLEEARFLSKYNIEYRYPVDSSEDLNPTPGELRKAFRFAKAICDDVMAGMPSEITEQRQQPPTQQPSNDQELEP